MASRAVEGTGTRGREHRRGQRRSEETEDAGPFVVRVDDGRKKKKRKRGDGRKVWSTAARKNGVDCIRSRPARRDHRTWTPSRQINTNPPPGTSVGGASGGAEGGRGRCPDRAGQRRRCRGRAQVACRPSEPIKAHNLERIRTAMVWHDRVVDNIALWYILSYVITKYSRLSPHPRESQCALRRSGGATETLP